MAAARPPPPVYVFNHYLLVGNSHDGKGGEGWADPDVNVGNGRLTGKAEEGWTNIEIARREAYGCGDNMRRALDGLSLCVRLGDDPLVTSTLGIRISSDARQSFISELGLDARKRLLSGLGLDARERLLSDLALAVLDEDEEEEEGEQVPSVVRIMVQEQDLLIIGLLLERNFRKLSYYLVYDRSDASLSMVSCVPDSLNVMVMCRPFPKRTTDGSYELFFLARERDDGRLPLASDTDPPPFLCVFSPVTGGAWEVRRTLRWNVPFGVFEMFRLDTTFSFQGKGFWADLSQALIYCDLHIASDGDSAVDFHCIELPGECQLNLKEMLDCGPPMEVTRTIACVGDSIWFVCIRRSKHHADDLVTMWTLELPWGKWKKEARFPVRELWTFDGFKEAEVPEAKAGYPLVTADGALSLVVTGQFFGYSYLEVSSVDHICTFDVRNKRLIWHGSVHDHTCTETVAFPPGFFQKMHGSHKRKFDELHPAAGPGFAAMVNGPIKGQGEPGDGNQGKSRTSSAGSRFLVARLLLLARFMLMLLLLSFVLILALDV